jgi:hypothetical protein
MTEIVQTLGPTDPNAPFAQKFYAISTGLLGIVGLAATFGLITSDQAASLTGVAGAAGTLLGAVGTAIAAFRTKKQLNNGTFDAAPPPIVVAPPISTADQIANAIPGVLQAAADGVAQVEKIKQAAADAFGHLPVVGGLAEQLIDSVRLP